MSFNSASNSSWPSAKSDSDLLVSPSLDLLKKLKSEGQRMANPPVINNIEAGFFNCRTANQCLDDAKKQPVPKELFYSLWFENELAILFADTGIGKSVYAVQIAEVISRNRKVLYIDLELSDKQFQKRYSEEFKNNYLFNENFYRVSFKSRYSIPEDITYEDYFIKNLIILIERTNAQVVIVDNMTRLISADTDKAQTAKPVMDRLNDLKFDYGLSMLCLEHTRKTSSFQPISLNDLQGSKMKSNFADSAFTIGRSTRDPRIRYVKQMKARNSDIIYDGENNMVYELIKETNFLHFEFIEYGNELDHLKQLDENEKSSRIQEAQNLRIEGWSNIAIAKKLGISEGAVRKWFKKQSC